MDLLSHGVVGGVLQKYQYGGLVCMLQLREVMHKGLLECFDFESYIGDKDKLEIPLKRFIRTNERLNNTTLFSIEFIRIDLDKKFPGLDMGSERNLILVFGETEELFSSIILDLQTGKVRLKVKKTLEKDKDLVYDPYDQVYVIVSDEFLIKHAKEVFAKVGIMDRFDTVSFNIRYPN